LEENGQCVDRNSNGVIDTSTGLGDIKAWSNEANADQYGGVSTTTDECILNYNRVHSTGARHVSVNSDNDVWVSSQSERIFDLIDGTTGQITRTEGGVGYGGYGGLISPEGVIWSAQPMLRWDTSLPLSGPNGTNWDGYGHQSYGLCIDGSGNVWNTELGGGLIRKFSPEGDLLGEFPHGSYYAQGCVVDGNDHVWVAHSLFSGTTVGHLLNDGTHIGNVSLPGGDGPTGVAVDSAGKIWSANINSSNASRIDPTAGEFGSDDVTPIGEVDLTVDLGAGANPYNYSDMTGSTLSGAPESGSWVVVYDGESAAAEWGTVDWTSNVTGDGSIRVFVSSGADGVTFGPEEEATDTADLTVANGQYLKIRVAFTRSSGGVSPILNDLTVATAPGPVAPVFQPDASITRGADAPVGGDVYSTDGHGQTVVVEMKADRSRELTVAFENDGTAPDSFTIQGCAPDPQQDGFSVKYFDGGIDVTEQVNRTGYPTGTLAPAASEELTVVVRILKTGLRRARTCLTTATSLGDTTKQDAVGVKLRQI
jgi:streptogramin lyase